MSARVAVILAFSVLLASLVAIDRRARQPRSQLASFGTVMGRLMATRSGRVGVLVVWWWLGWHFLAR